MFGLGAIALALSGLFHHSQVADVEIEIEAEIDTPYLPETAWYEVGDLVIIPPFAKGVVWEQAQVVAIDHANETVWVSNDLGEILSMDVSRVRLTMEVSSV